ncbi:hypothetical protein F5X99DRAFT_408579 [Biscogniauxia marginata]|nr:hypothetical protein F5X99DRAFT_408579 [Biscogniauxia marginata]
MTNLGVGGYGSGGPRVPIPGDSATVPVGPEREVVLRSVWAPGRRRWKMGRERLGQERGLTINLSGKKTAMTEAGDRIIVKLPGTGGWGTPHQANGIQAGERNNLAKSPSNPFLSVANGAVDIIPVYGEISLG